MWPYCFVPLADHWVWNYGAIWQMYGFKRLRLLFAWYVFFPFFLLLTYLNLSWVPCTQLIVKSFLSNLINSAIFIWVFRPFLYNVIIDMARFTLAILRSIFHLSPAFISQIPLWMTECATYFFCWLYRIINCSKRNCPLTAARGYGLHSLSWPWENRHPAGRDSMFRVIAASWGKDSLTFSTGHC